MTPPDGKHEQNPSVADRGSKWEGNTFGSSEFQDWIDWHRMEELVSMRAYVYKLKKKN